MQKYADYHGFDILITFVSESYGNGRVFRDKRHSFVFHHRAAAFGNNIAAPFAGCTPQRHHT